MPAHIVREWIHPAVEWNEFELETDKIERNIFNDMQEMFCFVFLKYNGGWEPNMSCSVTSIKY